MELYLDDSRGQDVLSDGQSVFCPSLVTKVRHPVNLSIYANQASPKQRESAQGFGKNGDEKAKMLVRVESDLKLAAEWNSAIAEPWIFSKLLWLNSTLKA